MPLTKNILIQENPALKANFNDLKDLHLAWDNVLASKSGSAFTEIPKREHLFNESESLATDLKSNFNQFVIIGIGGSSMGSRALVDYQNTKNIHFIDNVDSFEFKNLWTIIKSDFKKTAFIIISKSGSTIEVLWNLSAFENLAQKELKQSLIPNCFFISELTKNPLAEFAKKHQRPLLEVPLDVGGRFSVLTPVGLIIAALANYDLQALKNGASLALKEKEKVIYLCDLFLRSFDRKENITLFWFYNSNFRWFGGWLQQLWAESLGKKFDRAGQPAYPFSTPMIAIGSCDQHSILQQVAHGPKDKFVCIFDFNSAFESPYKIDHVLFEEINFMNQRNYGELIKNQSKATYQALVKNSVSTELFHIDDSNKSETLGYLFMLFQLIVATLGESKNINSYDQPGVTLGKEMALELLKL